MRIILLVLFGILMSFNGFATKLAEDTIKYDLVISFFSRASGIDMEAKKEVDQVLADVELKENIVFAKNETAWGREGEVDYCLHLDKLSKCAKKKMLKKLKSISNKSGRINLLENRNCLHQRQP